MKLTPGAIGGGRRIVCLESCASTNDEARRLAEEGAPHGTAVFTEEQTQGRGRFGRSWFAPRGSALLCSVILRPALDAERVPLMTVISALAAADAVESVGVKPAKIRFPNDVLVGSRKIAGVLAESRFAGERPYWFIVGIGLNVNVRREEFPDDLREAATSLAIEQGADLDRAGVARALLAALDHWVDGVAGPGEMIRRAWTERSAILGQVVRIHRAGAISEAVVVAVDPLEGLTVRDRDGSSRLIRGEHIDRLELL